MNNYISYIQKTLQEDFINNNVITFVCAGFSKNAQFSSSVNMPDWNELGKITASYIMKYDYTNTLDALSVFENELSRVKLIELLQRELHINESQSSPTYISFL